MYRIILFAREYYAQPLKFLTLTFPPGAENHRIALQQLMEFLRKMFTLEYLAVRTGEGNGVYHICLVSPFIDQALIREKWESLTGAYRVNISKEKSISSLVREMTRQQDTMRYSMSRKFLPQGSIHALDRLSKEFRGNVRIKSYGMLARRLRFARGDIIRAYYRTAVCMRQLNGRCSDIRSHQEYCL